MIPETRGYGCRWVRWVAIGISCTALAAGDVGFTSVDPGKVLRADGSGWPDGLEVAGWKWLPNAGNGGVLQAVPPEGAEPGILMMWIEGLEPGTKYQVSGGFWCDPQEGGATAGRHGAAQFGLSMAQIHPFAGVKVEKEPWVVVPDSMVGKSFGYSVALADEANAPGMRIKQDGGHLAIAGIGVAVAGSDGRLPVFFADYAGYKERGPAAIDGVWVAKAPADADPEQGWMPGTIVHRALRAGDMLTLQRALDAGADINALDEDGLPPLFYAVAAGDQELVRKLMAAGARAEVEGQSLSPLVASATNSDVEMTRLLLDAGVKVPLTLPEGSGALRIGQDPRYLHPVLVAVRSGSLRVLQLLLESAPGIDIVQLAAGPDGFKHDHKKHSDRYSTILLRNAAEHRHWDMAAFLVKAGFKDPSGQILQTPEERQIFLADVIYQAGPEAMPLIEALMADGIPAVEKLNRRYKTSVQMPRDPLTAAISAGKLDLVRRFLPSADAQTADYHRILAELAVIGSNPEMVALIKDRYPEAMPGPSEPVVDREPVTAGGAAPARLFLPRTRPSSVDRDRPADGARHTMAVIAEPVAAGPAASLEAIAAEVAGWKVVDREEVEQAMKEAQMNRPWNDGEYRMADLGDRLAADCLVIVSEERDSRTKIYRFEVVEVATGLELHREHFPSHEFDPGRDLGALVLRASQALTAAAADRRHQAVTLLTFSANERMADSLALCQVMRAAVRREVDSTPGFITMTRAQSSRLVEEQALHGLSELWAASHLIEGSVSPAGEHGVRVELRLETIRDGGSSRTDVGAAGRADDIPALVAGLWQQLLAKVGAVPAQGATVYQEQDARQEARRLLSEAEWMLRIGRPPAEVLPLIESAGALGAPMGRLVDLHLEALARQIDSFAPNWKGQVIGNTKPLTKLDEMNDKMYVLPVPIATADGYMRQLPLCRSLLHQASWYLARYGTDYLSQPGWQTGQCIWQSIQMLSYIRAAVHDDRLSPADRAEWQVFGEELDGLVRRYFDTLAGIEHPTELLYKLQMTDKLVLERNPALLDCMVELALTSAPLRVICRHGWWRTEKGFELLARRIIERIGDDPSPYLQFKKADLELRLAGADEAPAAVRRMTDAGIRLMRAWKDRDFGQVDIFPVSRDILDRHSTSFFFHRVWVSHYVYHGSCMIPALLHSPRPTPDMHAKFTHYLFGSQPYRLLDNEPPALPGMYEDAFRRQYNGYITGGFNAPPDGFIRRSRVRLPKFTVIDKECALPELLSGAVKPSPDAPDPRTTAPVMATPLAVDLRGDHPVGMAIWPLVDRADPNVLWIHYFQSVNDDVPVGIQRMDGETWTQPELLAVDCRSGEIIHRIDLLKEAGPMTGRGAVADPCEIWRMSLDQTQRHLMVNVGERSFTVDKQSGEMQPLPHRGCAQEGWYDFGFLRVGVAGIGDRFFFLDRPNTENGGAVAGGMGYSVFEVGPDLEVRPLTVRGRRPEKTPFDGVGCSPGAITEHNGRLAVANGLLLAYYDPATGTWSEEIEALPKAHHMFPIHDDHFWQYMTSLNEIRIDGKSTGWILLSWNHRPGVMRVVHREKGLRFIRTETLIPEDYRNRAMACNPDGKNPAGGTKYKRTPLGEHPQFNPVDISVVAQTDDDLIFSAHTGDAYRWLWPSRDDLMLPFLWKFPKKDLLKLIGE